MTEGNVTITDTIHRHPKPPLQKGVRILQLTDCHLHADTQWRLAGVNTRDSFASVISLAETHAKTADLVLLTGDLVHDSSATGYQRLTQEIGRFQLPTYCLAGNHDEPAMLNQLMKSDLVSAPKAVDLGSWLLILLDSHKPGSVGGELTSHELEQLEQLLENHPQHHVLICLHHHPVPINSAWMDNIALKNPNAFFRITDQHSNIRGILWGHIHQEFEGERNGVKLMATPSTCIQFIKNQDQFGICPSPPGYRWLELLPDGSINSAVERVAELPEGLILETAGY